MLLPGLLEGLRKLVLLLVIEPIGVRSSVHKEQGELWQSSRGSEVVASQSGLAFTTRTSAASGMERR